MNSAVAEVGFGKPDEAVDLVVGYQPYTFLVRCVINGQQQACRQVLTSSSNRPSGFCHVEEYLGYMGYARDRVNHRQDTVDIRRTVWARHVSSATFRKERAPEFERYGSGCDGR